MRLPRMTTRQLIVAVALVAVWLAFVARGDRLRSLSYNHQQQYLRLSRARLFGGRDGGQAPAPDIVQEAWHLRMVKEYNVEADFVESFALALLLSGISFAIVVVVRRKRRRSVPPPRETGCSGSEKPVLDHQ